MNSVFIKLTGNNDSHKILDRLEFRLNLTSHFGVTCPVAVKENDVSSFSPVPLIRYMSKMQVTRTGIKARTSSNLGRVGFFTIELRDLERSHWLWIQYSSNLEVMGTAGEFEFWSYLTYHFGVTCPWAVKQISPAFLSHIWLDLCQICR